MRRYVFRLAILSLAVLTNGTLWAGDQEIAQQIIEKLQAEKQAGTLKGFSIDLQVDDGTVWLTGRVASEQQQARALDLARRVGGVKQVVNDLSIAPPPGKAVASSPAKPAASRATVAPVEAGTNEYFAGAVSEQPAPPAPPASRRETASSKLLSSVSKTFSGGSKRAEAVQPAHEQPAPQSIAVEAVPIQATPVETAQYPVPVPVEPTTVRSASVSQQVANATGSGAVGSGVGSSARQSVVQAAQPVANAPHQLATAESLQPLYAQQPQQMAMAPMQMPYMVPVYAGSTMQVPLAMGAARPVNYMGGPVQVPDAGMGMGAAPGVSGAPVPMYMPGSGVGIAPARYDHPSMPGYAWPSYAAYPNYAAVTYPKQYSPTAWPYIGPFYPYPQVPLGWRKVTMEWDDGWWFLDFKDRRTMYNH